MKDAKVVFDFSKNYNHLHSNSVHLLGFGYDGTACFRKGTRRGPEGIREVVWGIEGFSPYLNLDLEDFDNLYDLGDLEVGESNDEEKNWRQATDEYLSLISTESLKEQGVKTLLLGGEHSVSYAPIRRYLDAFENLTLIHLDAHADLRDGYEGYHYSHASVIRRSLDHFGPDHQLIQYGIRSGTKDEYALMKEKKSLCISRKELLDRVDLLDPKRPIYLTLDLDYFDPCFVPGTGTPEPGGEDFHSFISLIKKLREKNLVGADVVELSPDLDSK